LAVISSDCNERPVALPPGRARLANKPAPTGSEAMAKTIGIVCDAFFAAIAAAMLLRDNVSHEVGQSISSSLGVTKLKDDVFSRFVAEFMQSCHESLK
jgi:hypothetical protein